MSVLDNLNRIKSCKEDIKQAIIDKGVDMSGVSLEGYATKISEIQAGGGSGDYLDIRANLSTYYSTAEKVYEYAFVYCSTIQSVDLPMCSYVDINVFFGCRSLQSVNLPMCEYVGNDTFKYCKSLQSIDLPNCSYVGTYAFNSCASLQSVNLPMCESVGNYTFQYCASLQSIDLPNCSYVGLNAFSSCESLQSVNLPNCSYVSNGAFAYCPSLSVLDLRSTYSCVLTNSKAFTKTPFASGIGSIYVHAAHLSQFQNATNWTYFSKCFVGVGDLTNPLLSFDSGRVYGDTYHLYSNWTSYLGITSSSVISIDLPNLVSVVVAAFSSCSSLQSIDLPMCEYVGSSAFYGCKSLQSIDLPMCEYVGSSAFYGCKSLQSVNLPMCEYVGGSVFYNCNDTLDVYIGTSISKVCQAGGVQIFTQDFDTNKYLVNKIFVPMSLVDAYKSAQYWSDYASHIFGI